MLKCLHAVSEKILRALYIYVDVKFDPNPTLHDLNITESTLPGDASTQV